MILSTYIAYYIRIYEQDKRNKLKNILIKIIGGKFSSYPKFLSKYKINQIELEPEVSQNRALVENYLQFLFVLII